MKKEQAIQAMEERKIEHKKLAEDTNYSGVQYLVNKAIYETYAHCIEIVKKIER